MCGVSKLMKCILLGAHHCFVGQFFYGFIPGLNIPLNKTYSPVCFCHDVSDIRIPVQILRDSYPIMCCFKHLTMEGILGLKWLLWPCDTEHLAFARIKLPCCRFIPILVAYQGLSGGSSYPVKNLLSSRLPYHRQIALLGTERSVVGHWYTEQKEERPENRILRDTYQMSHGLLMSSPFPALEPGFDP